MAGFPLGRVRDDLAKPTSGVPEVLPLGRRSKKMERGKMSDGPPEPERRSDQRRPQTPARGQELAKANSPPPGPRYPALGTVWSKPPAPNRHPSFPNHQNILPRTRRLSFSARSFFCPFCRFFSALLTNVRKRTIIWNVRNRSNFHVPQGGTLWKICPLTLHCWS